MALFGIAVMVGPVLGPVLGGWLTENYSWRWVFYINLPIGALAFLGITAFLPDTDRNADAKLDWFGFATLSFANWAPCKSCSIAANSSTGLGSGEIWIEGIIAGSAFYLFLVHTFTADEPFVKPAVFRDRNFAAGMAFIFIVGVTYLASLALMTPYLQSLMNYPIVTAGLVLGPRGIGTMAAMMIVGRLVGRVDIRLLLVIWPRTCGLVVLRPDRLDADVSQMRIMGNGVVQGAGSASCSCAEYSELGHTAAGATDDGTALFNLSRNIGLQCRISVVTSLLTQNTQAITPISFSTSQP